MSKHTPGPWRVIYKDHALYSLESQRNPGEAEANARLIAAAPEMYEAMGRLLAVLDEHATGSYGDAEDDCRALLAKIDNPSRPEA